MARVVVVGAGVAGLCSAVALLRAGHRVDVVARDLPRETGSALSPGLWRDPGPGAEPRVRRWAERTRTALLEDAERPGSPARVLPGVLDDVETEGLVVDVPAWLDRLAAEVDRLGGSLTRLQVSALPTGADVVVQCTGLGARHFARDAATAPVREQQVLLDVEEPRWWYRSGLEPTWGVPVAGGLLVGGLRRSGEWDRTVRDHDTEALLARVRTYRPALGRAPVLATRVGLWPARREVCLERVGDVVHHHGHGPDGTTLAWGAAADVVALVEGSSGGAVI